MKRFQVLMVCAAALTITSLMANPASAQLFPIFPPKYNDNGDRVGLFGRVKSSYPKATFAGGGCTGYSAGYSYSVGSGCTGYSAGYSYSYPVTYSYSQSTTTASPTKTLTGDNCYFTTSMKSNWPYSVAWVNSSGCVMAFFANDQLAGDAPYGMTKAYRDQAPAATAKPTKGAKAVMPPCGNPDCTCVNCSCDGPCHCKAAMPAETAVMAPAASVYYQEPCYGPNCPTCQFAR